MSQPRFYIPESAIEILLEKAGLIDGGPTRGMVSDENLKAFREFCQSKVKDGFLEVTHVARASGEWINSDKMYARIPFDPHLRLLLELKNLRIRK